MDPDRWRRLEEWVARALDLDAAARAAFLDALDARDAEVAREVRELVAHERGAERIQAGGALASAAPAQPLQPLAAPGRRVGPWRLVRSIGRGGMGEVWLGERVDGGFAQRAAIKLVVGAAASRESRERFLRERRLLAELEHAHIARLIDGGETEHGEPYLAMELVDGVAIDRWCDQRGATLRERVAAIAEVCDAVHFAHQRLIVHRDLKPSNLMVTADGATKLLDFGVAKLLEPEAGDELTSAGFLTPRYASPEQVRGAAVTTASDVYSLGVVLFELATGAEPYGVASSAPLVLAQAVLATPPRRASASVVAHAAVARAAGGAARLERALAGDVDTILAKALAKDPERRYATAAELGDDLRRWLERKPVLARPDTWSYRTRKLVARNQFASAAVAAFALALVVGLVASWSATARAVRAEQRAERRFAQVRELARTLAFGVHDRVSELGGSTELRRYLVDTTRRYLDDLAAEGDLSPELADEVAATYLRLAEVQGGHTRGGTGDVEGALESARRALELWRTAREHLPSADARMARAHGLLGDLERFAGRTDAAAAHYDELERLARAGLARDSSDVEALRSLSRAIGQRGRLAALAGDRARSLACSREAREVLRPIETNAAVARDVVVLSIRIADELNRLGEPARAIEELAPTIASADAARLGAKHDAQLALDYANAKRELARSHAALQDWPAAHASLEAAIDALRPIHAADARNFVVGEALSIALETLGGWRRSHGDRAAALALYHESLAIMEALHAAGSGDRYVRDGVVQLSVLAGLVEQELGRSAQARERFERALELLGPTSPDERDEFAAEIRFTVEFALAELELGDVERHAAGAAFERLWTDVAAIQRTYPDVAWPVRKRGLVAKRLGEWLEQRAASSGRSPHERRADLERARELYAIGADDGRRLRDKNWLLASEQDLVARFEADAARCDDALKALDAQVGP